MRIAYRAEGKDDHYLPEILWWQRPGAAILGDEAFGEITGVQLLDLPATDDDLRYLASLPTVERVNLTGTQVTDAGLKHLRVCPRLTFLSLEGTAITDAGVAELARHSNLAGLSLNGTQVTDEALASLAQMPSLKQLWLEETAITDRGYKRLATALPDCDISADVPSARQGRGSGGFGGVKMGGASD
jgi:hypothetical protein